MSYGPDEQRALDMSRHSSDYVAADLTPSELQAIETKRRALKELLGPEDLVATYKLEFHFGKGRTGNGNFPGLMHMFTSGSALSGGGDEPIYPCPDDQCPGVIPQKLVGHFANRAVCPTCQRVWTAEMAVVGETRVFVLPVYKWAKVAARYFVRLNHDAALYMKYYKEDLIRHTVAEQELGSRGGGDKLHVARTRRERVLYPLANIYKDLQAGADLESRFLAFFRA